MKVRVASVGKDRSGLFAPAVEEYASRLRHYTKFSLLELPASRTAALEADALLGKRQPSELLVALDQRGKNLSSEELAKFIEKAQHQAKDLYFVIGGDEGLDERVRAAASLTLSLSRMTLPHRLARVVLVEQIYRAFTLLRAEPYHK
ncbi:MAG: 23S rRNA (pseudouridine(1915)-N(3))-methyltransferase RlmH [Myxococcaceae bacterium]